MIRKMALVRRETGLARPFYRTPPGDGEADDRMLLPAAKVLILEEIEDGFFLDRFSESGQPLDDSWHDSLEDALGQARLEYEVREGDWVDIPDDISSAYDFLFPRQGD